MALGIWIDAPPTFHPSVYLRSDPKHESYGQYLSIDEISDVIRPPATRLDAVLDFLAANKLEGEVNAYGDFVTVRTEAR